MNTQPDPVREALGTLRAQTWNRPEHQLRLERELQERMTMSMRTSLWAKAAIITGIFVVGGVAGAGTLAFVEHYFVEETDLPGDMTHVRITDTDTQQVVMDEDIPDDSGIFVIEGDENEGDTLLNLQAVPGQEGAAKSEASKDGAAKTGAAAQDGH
jgi:hypothetical protein